MTTSYEAGAGSNLFASLQKQRFIQLTTLRKSGAGVSTEVWFAEHAGKIYVMTLQEAGKLKRIRNNASVSMAACKYSGEVIGEQIAGVARILPKAEETEAHAALARKYKPLFTLFQLGLRLRKVNRVYIEIVPLVTL